MTNRAAVYIDGLNLYYGLRTKGWQRYYWLDLYRLSENLLLPNQKLISVTYCTAPIKPDDKYPDRDLRQSTYLDALSTLPGICIKIGYFLSKTKTCPNCGEKRKVYEEKMTDVNLATSMLVDAYQDKYDTAILVSADSDLVPPVAAILERFPHKRVVIAFPPKRYSVDLKKTATTSFTIGRRKFAKSQLPNTIIKNSHTLTRPNSWT